VILFISAFIKPEQISPKWVKSLAQGFNSGSCDGTVFSVPGKEIN